MLKKLILTIALTLAIFNVGFSQETEDCTQSADVTGQVLPQDSTSSLLLATGNIKVEMLGTNSEYYSLTPSVFGDYAFYSLTPCISYEVFPSVKSKGINYLNGQSVFFTPGSSSVRADGSASTFTRNFNLLIQ